MHSKKNVLFAPEKLNIGLFQRAESTIILFVSIVYRGQNPISTISQFVHGGAPWVGLEHEHK
jgi:hypothetical protein